MPGIGINQSNLNERATALKDASNHFEVRTLNPVDTESTITANQNAQRAFEEAQQGHNHFSEQLAISAVEIKDIGDRFFTIDEQAANIMQ